jgi:subtilase family serine protease
VHLASVVEVSMRVHLGSGRRLAAVLVAAATGIALSAAVTPAQAAGHRHELPDSLPHWLHKARAAGAVGGDAEVRFGVLLKLSDQAGAETLVRQLSDPASARYGHWLTGSQFRSRFAPAASDVAAVQHWLQSQGFAVDKTLRSGLLVEAHGSAAKVERTFATNLHRYRFHGATVHANTTPLSLPEGTSSAVVGSVAGVVGLDQGSTLKQPADTLPGPPPGARYGVQPCSSYFGQKIARTLPPVDGRHQPFAVCGYTPRQLQSAYGVAPLLRHGVDGRGVTVAITDAYAAPTLRYDADKYATVHGQPRFRRGQLSQITPPPDGYSDIDLCGPQGWYGEETLDVEAVHNLAPGAKVVYVAGSNCLEGLDDAWASSIDNHVADVITNSWTDGVDDLADLGQTYVDFYREFSVEAALTGITVSFSSGDDGDHTAGGTDLAAKTVEFPADLPYVTGVGGTSLEVGRHGQWRGEYGWQTAYAELQDGSWGPSVYSSGGGGGASQLFGQPFYQRGVVPAWMSHLDGSAMRTVPDIAMVGDPNTGMLVGETQQFPDGTYWDQYRIGGTSLSSPLLAGMVAVAGQRAGRPLGFANPLFYRMLGTRGLHDEVAPRRPVHQVRTELVNGVDRSAGLRFRLQTIDVQSSTLHDVPGYDDETGVGSPAGPAFFEEIAHLLR